MMLTGRGNVSDFSLLEKARYAQYEIRLSSVVLIAVVRCLVCLC